MCSPILLAGAVHFPAKRREIFEFNVQKYESKPLGLTRDPEIHPTLTPCVHEEEETPHLLHFMPHSFQFGRCVAPHGGNNASATPPRRVRASLQWAGMRSVARAGAAALGVGAFGLGAWSLLRPAQDANAAVRPRCCLRRASRCVLSNCGAWRAALLTTRLTCSSLVAAPRALDARSMQRQGALE